MKNNKMPKSALLFLLAGLLIAVVTPLIKNHFHLPGFITGLLQ